MACLLLHLGMQAFNDLMAGGPRTVDLDCIGPEVRLIQDEGPAGS